MDEHGQLQPRNESRSQASPSPAAKRPSWADESEAHADHEPDGDAGDGHSHHEVEDHRPWYLPPITHEDLHPQGGDHDDSTKAILDRLARGVPRPNGNAPSFSHFPEHAADDAEHPDTGRHGDFESTAPVGNEGNGNIGPASPRGATPPMGRSPFQAPRSMQCGYAQQEATTYGAAADNRGNGSNSAYTGNQPAATPPSTRPLTIQEVLEQGKAARANYEKAMRKETNTEVEANTEVAPTVEELEQKEKQLEAEAKGARQALHNQLEPVINFKKCCTPVRVQAISLGWNPLPTSQEPPTPVTSAMQNGTFAVPT